MSVSTHTSTHLQAPSFGQAVASAHDFSYAALLPGCFDSIRGLREKPSAGIVEQRKH